MSEPTQNILPDADLNIQLDTIESAIADIRAGKVIIVGDDEDRENEGDFIGAAECITPEIVNFMATHGRGLICAPIEEQRADELNLDLMVSSNNALHETAFTVSVDLIGQGCTTGISAYDRATCIKALIHPNTRPEQLARPGHIFPLRSKAGGVLRRTGHTEAAVDLAKLAGMAPAGVLVEILNEDGSMARLPQLVEIAQRFDLKIISIKDLVAYRMRNERIVKKELEVSMPTKFGEFEIHAFRQLTTGDVHLAIKMGEWTPDDSVLVRAHSSTETGDILGTLFEDYGVKLRQSMYMIAEEGRGLLLYLRHGEKGNTILQRLQAYQEAKRAGKTYKERRETSVAQRDYGVGAQILRDMNVRKIRLLTDNPRRRVGMIGFGLEIVEVVDLKVE